MRPTMRPTSSAGERSSDRQTGRAGRHSDDLGHPAHPEPGPLSPAAYFLHLYGDEAASRRAPVWLEWRATDQEGWVTAREYDGPRGLFGRRVDSEWEGAAVVGTGRFRLLDDAHEPPAVLQPGFSGGLIMACAVRRDGWVDWRMNLPDGTSCNRVPEEGFMLDVLKRSLDLATPPPPSSIAPLELGAWIASITTTSGTQGRRLDWDEAIRLHPALGETTGEETVEVLPLLRARNAADDWDLMRRLVASGLATAIAPDPSVASWMDAGMFSRWVLDGLPSLADLLAMVRPHLESTAYRQVHHLARRLDDRLV